MTMLRRLQVATYPAERMVTLEQLQEMRRVADESETPLETALDPLLLPMDTAVSHFPQVNLTDVTAGILSWGSRYGLRMTGTGDINPRNAG